MLDRSSGRALKGAETLKMLEPDQKKLPIRAMSIQYWLEQYAPGALTADGFDDAILGYVERRGEHAVVLYDVGKCIEILMSRDKMTEQEAQEYFDFNVVGSWMGKRTPMFLWRRPEA